MRLSHLSLIPTGIGLALIFTVGDHWLGFLGAALLFSVAILMAWLEDRREKRAVRAYDAPQADDGAAPS